MSYQAKLEKEMRERLEKSGQAGKMRAMIVEAALQALYMEDAKSDNNDQSDNQQQHFMPSPSLIEAKSSSQGKEMLANVYKFLDYLGLEYTANVFCMETGLSKDSLCAITHNDEPKSQSTFMEKLNFSALASLPHTDSINLNKYGSDVGTLSLDKPSGTDTMDHKNSVNNLSEEQTEGEDTTYNISSWKKRSFVRANGVVSGQQVQIEYLTDCQVLILDPLDSVTVDDCEGGELIIAACEGSVFLRNCKRLRLHVACKQLRLRDCADLDLRVFTTTDPVIEMSHHIEFRPFHLSLPGLQRSFSAARLDPKLNRFVHVYDFTAGEGRLPRPHFTVRYPHHGLSLEERHAEYGTPEHPAEIAQLLKGTLLPAASSEAGGGRSFDIKSGAKIWAELGDAESETTSEPPAIAGVESAPRSLSPIADVGKQTEKNSHDDGHRAGYSGAPKVDKRPVGGLTGRPPAAPATQAGGIVRPNAREASLEDQSYSSFEDESIASDRDQYKVEEDDDDF